MQEVFDKLNELAKKQPWTDEDIAFILARRSYWGDHTEFDALLKGSKPEAAEEPKKKVKKS